MEVYYQVHPWDGADAGAAEGRGGDAEDDDFAAPPPPTPTSPALPRHTAWEHDRGTINQERALVKVLARLGYRIDSALDGLDEEEEEEVEAGGRGSERGGAQVRF